MPQPASIINSMYIKIWIHQHHKYLVDLVPHYHPTIAHFAQRIIDLCDLPAARPQDLVIEDDGFILPHLLSSDCLTDSKVYTVRIVHKGKKCRKAEKMAQKKQQSDESSDGSSSQEEQIRKKVQQKEQSSQSPITPRVKKLPKQKQEPEKLRKESEKLRKEPERKLSSVNKKVEKPKLKVAVQKPSQSSEDAWSSSSSGEESDESPLSAIPRKQVRPKPEQSLKPAEKPVAKQQPAIKPTQAPRPSKISVPIRSRIVKDSSSPSSSESPMPVKKPTVIPKAIEGKGEQKGGAKIPISVRNRIQQKPKSSQNPDDFKSKFQLHQQAQWLTITKTILEQWGKDHPGLPLLACDNEIKFKIMELDEEKFIPVLSGWITGMIKNISGQKETLSIELDNCTKAAPEGSSLPSEYLKTYRIPMVNIQELQIKKMTLRDTQKQLQADKAASNNEAPKQQQQVHSEAKPQDQQKPVQSLQDFICGQISYYFSDKNYESDLFMQMHANMDPDRYIKIGLMLNFPKIKKVLKDEDKLWEFLSGDEKLKIRNYELDPTRRMLRKKKGAAGRPAAADPDN